MTAQITRQAIDSITIEVTMPLTGSMLQAEEAIQDALNEVGRLATEKNLQQFDTDGSPIQLGSVRMTSKGQFAQDYETPYGSISVLRHVYQTSEGGKTFCPLEEDARMVLNATPRFAKLVSYKYAEAGADAVVADLLECNHRKVSKRYVKSLGDIVGAYAVAKEETWSYALPEFERPCASIAIGVDGTCMLLQEDGWRLAMTGTIAFYDAQGERLHTIYAGATPEYGKEKFHAKFQREVERVKGTYPNVPYIGLGDGAADNWSYLKPLTDHQTLDFYHASEYVGKTAMVMFKGAKKKAEREAWLENQLHQLKHKQGAASRVLSVLDEFLSTTTAEKRGRCEDGPGDDHLPPKPEGADEILLFGAAELADRQRRDRSGMQDLDQAPPMQIGLALEGRWGSRRIVDTRAATHYRPLGRVLAEPRPIWLPNTPRVTSYCASTRCG